MLWLSNIVYISECTKELVLFERDRLDIDCLERQVLREVSLEDCQKRACQIHAKALAYLDKVCHLYFCVGKLGVKHTNATWKIYLKPEVEISFKDDTVITAPKTAAPGTTVPGTTDATSAGMTVWSIFTIGAWWGAVMIPVIT